MVYFFAFVLLAGCVLTGKQKQEPFTLLDANAQEQRAGVHGGGSTKDYTFRLLVTTSEPLKFDSVWAEGQMLEVRIEKNGHLLGKNEQLAKHDTLTLHASSFIPAEPGTSTQQPPATTEPPVAFSGKALISYFHAGSPGHFTVTAIRELPPVIMH